MLLLTAAVAAGGCFGEGGSGLLAAEECPAVGSESALGNGAALAVPPQPSVVEEAAAPIARRGTTRRGDGGVLPTGPLFQPLLGSGTDAHSARCDPFDDPFGACI